MHLNMCTWMSIHKFQCQSKKIRGGVGGSGSRPPPTTTTSKLKFDILDLKKKNSGKSGVVVGGCLVLDPPTTTPKPKLIMSSHEM